MRKLFVILLPFIPIHILVFYLSYTGQAYSFILFSLALHLLIAWLVSKKLTKNLTGNVLMWTILCVIHLFFSLLFLVLTMWIPGSKEHNYLMYNVCLPAMKKAYGLKENEFFPDHQTDKYGYFKWLYQVSECEKNIKDGKGPVFSENPPGFVPVVQ